MIYYRSIRIVMCITLLIIASISLGYSQADTVNLVKNASFEESTYNPWQPTAWTLGIEGSAHGTFSSANDGFHGRSSARLTNQSQRRPSVFIWLSQDIAVKRNTDYVISMYVRCKSVGYSWFGGGPNWLMRELLPQDTGGKWVRVSAPCNSRDSDTWKLIILSEDITEDLDIDAVQMEEGKVVTEFHGEPFAATLENKSYAGVYESPKEVDVSLKVNNYQGRTLPVTSSWQLRRLPEDQAIAQGNVSLEVESNESAQARLPFPQRAGYGLYEYMVSALAEGYKIEFEARVAIMRTPPKDREMDHLGFNIHVAQDDYARLLRRLGLRWARVDWHWYLCEPGRRGEVAWDFMDIQVQVADKYGLNLFPIFGAGNPPAWAQLKDDTFNPQEHADYVRRVLERYKGKISAFNVWNEPDASAIKNPNLWLADVKAVHEAARSVDPGIKVVGIAMSGHTGDPGDWHYPLLKPPISLGQHLDAYDWHNYPAPRNRRPEETSEFGPSGVDDLRESVPKLRALAAGKEVWITEHGFSMCNPLNPIVVKMVKDFPPGAPFDVTEKQQADYLVRQVILELAYGVDRVFIYQLGPDTADESYEGQFGITRIRSNGPSAKLAYVQIANMIYELAGATPVGVEMPSPNIRVVRFRRGSTDIVATWTVRGTAEMKFQVKDGYQSNPFGNRNSKQGAVTVEITESPIFLVGKKVR